MEQSNNPDWHGQQKHEAIVVGSVLFFAGLVVLAMVIIAFKELPPIVTKIIFK